MTETSPSSGAAAAPEREGPSYTFKPSLMGAPHEFWLGTHELQWRVGTRYSRIHYSQIRWVRLSFRPMTLQNRRFLAEIWSSDGPTLRIASTSWKSMVELERHDEAYRAFITELHRRLMAQGPRAQFLRGTPALTYWSGLVVFVAVCLAAAALLVRAMQEGAFSGAAFIAAFSALFVWRIGNFFRRNRPGDYRPDAIPSAVMPELSS